MPVDLLRSPEETLKVAREAVLDAGPQDLHRHVALFFTFACGLDARLVYLRDGSGGNRRTDLAENLAHRLAKSFLDDRAGLAHGEGRQLVLQRAQIPCESVADNVRPRCKKLPELDIGGPKRCERRCQPLARIACGLRLRFPGKTDFRKRHQRQQHARHFRSQFQREQGIVPPENACGANKSCN